MNGSFPCRMRAAAKMTPELLAPAGDIHAALAALDAGADAVYCGLQKFNARVRSVNFTEEEYGSLIRYAHENGKKVYTTFNTVIKEDEIDEAADFLACLDSLHPDAVIVQDFGVVRMIREFFPRLVMHGSTQMALHNSDDIAAAASAGIRRVILERQTTLEEIRLIAEKSPVEIELFIHGALCCCLSGTCLLSSWFGGASGNRGQCKQPCRRLFRNASGKEGFFLSTKDLAAGALIPRFKKMGIASLKIEGRLRKPDYVSKVTAAYRLLLDAPEERFDEALREAESMLARTASRTPSIGFYSRESAKNVISSGEPGGIGQVCGHVTRVLSDAFEVLLSARVHVGDNIRVQSSEGDTGEALCILSMTVGGKKTVKAFPGQKCIIQAKNKKISADGILYKIGESCDTMERRIANLPPFRPELSLAASLNAKGLKIAFPDFPGKVWERPLALTVAEKHPVREKELAEAFSGFGETPFVPVCREVRIDGDYFLPKSVLKDLRREFREWSSPLFPAGFLKAGSGERAEKLKRFHASLHASPREEQPEIILTGSDPMEVLPFFIPETELAAFHEKTEQAYSAGKREFRIGSFGGFLLKKKHPEIRLAVFAPLPLANSFAALEFREMGAAEGLIHIELGKEDMELLAEKSPLPLQMYAEGHPVIFATRAGVEKGEYLSAPDGERFLMKRDEVLTGLVSGKKLLLPPVSGVRILRDLRMKEEFSDGKNRTSEFNFERGLN